MPPKKGSCHGAGSAKPPPGPGPGPGPARLCPSRRPSLPALFPFPPAAGPCVPARPPPGFLPPGHCRPPTCREEAPARLPRGASCRWAGRKAPRRRGAPPGWRPPGGQRSTRSGTWLCDGRQGSTIAPRRAAGGVGAAGVLLGCPSPHLRLVRRAEEPPRDASQEKAKAGLLCSEQMLAMETPLPKVGVTSPL